MDAEQVLAFRFARSGLVARSPDLAAAAACPASDFYRDGALLALAARSESLTAERYARAVDEGEVVVTAHAVRGAIHTLAPADLPVYGRALIPSEEDELQAQLGSQVQRLAVEEGVAVRDALEEVTAATEAALRGGRPLNRNELHEALRRSVRAAFLPWCQSCRSHHVAPMLWRYATVAASARLDSARRYLLAAVGEDSPGAEAVRRFLTFYGPATVADFADWAGVSKSHARHLWEPVEGELAEVVLGRRRTWLLGRDAGELDSPRTAEGVRLIPPGDPYLQRPNRALLAPAAELRRRLFRPVASPGVVLQDGRLAGLWRMKVKGQKAEISVERLGGLDRRELGDEADRLARLRGASDTKLAIA